MKKREFEEPFDILLSNYIKENPNITKYAKVIKKEENFKQKDIVHTFAKNELTKYKKNLTVTVLYEDVEEGIAYIYFNEEPIPFLEELKEEALNEICKG